MASYNVENYLLHDTETRRAKPPESRQKVAANLRLLQADVIALQEMGDTNALLELRDRLAKRGLDYPYWEHVTGWDTNIHLSVLSRHPIVARRPHTNKGYVTYGRRLSVSRGFLEVDIEADSDLRFTLLVAHLKSRREIALADQADMRMKEAGILRRIVNEKLRRNPRARIVVVGDMNDTCDSPPMKLLIGRGRNALLDTRPAERNGDNLPHPNPRYRSRKVTWTYHFGREDTYQRIDYILLSPGMARIWHPEETHVLTVANWGQASDHRPLKATFRE